MTTLREISLLKQLDSHNHPNIVKLLDVIHGKMERETQLVLFLVFEHLEQDLAEYMTQLPPSGMTKVTIQVILSLSRYITSKLKFNVY